jgi:hypothetical protein
MTDAPSSSVIATLRRQRWPTDDFGRFIPFEDLTDAQRASVNYERDLHQIMYGTEAVVLRES